MPDTKNIPVYSSLTEAQKQELRKGFHSDDLNYLASFAIETGSISATDIESINSKIDARVRGTSALNSFYILLCGIFIGVSVFFVFFEKNKTKQAHYQAINEVPAPDSKTQTTNAPSNSEASPSKGAYRHEHFSIQHSGEKIPDNTEVYENLDTKTVSEINLRSTETAESAAFIYIPNAPVIFVAGLKVSNYKVYYFKNNENILMNDEGVSAPYADRNEAGNSNLKTEEEPNYYAHQILKDALNSFNAKDYKGCIGLMELLYNYNKSDVNAQFYLGMCYFYLSNNLSAERCFNEVLINNVNVFQQEAEFYKALCVKNKGQFKEAEILLQDISSRKLFYAKRADEILKEMN